MAEWAVSGRAGSGRAPEENFGRSSRVNPSARQNEDSYLPAIWSLAEAGESGVSCMGLPTFTLIDSSAGTQGKERDFDQESPTPPF